MLGTPEFMSPEQLRGQPLDARSDIYALALVTFEVLTAQLPFRGRTKNEAMLARLTRNPTPLRDLRPDLVNGAAVEAVLLKALARDPADRYRTAPAFAEALATAANGSAAPRQSTGWLRRLLGRG